MGGFGSIYKQKAALAVLELVDTDKALGGPAMWLQHLHVFAPSPCNPS